MAGNIAKELSASICRVAISKYSNMFFHDKDHMDTLVVDGGGDGGVDGVCFLINNEFVLPDIEDIDQIIEKTKDNSNLKIVLFQAKYSLSFKDHSSISATEFEKLNTDLTLHFFREPERYNGVNRRKIKIIKFFHMLKNSKKFPNITFEIVHVTNSTKIDASNNQNEKKFCLKI